jgi:hypothetical protein
MAAREGGRLGGAWGSAVAAMVGGEGAPVADLPVMSDALEPLFATACSGGGGGIEGAVVFTVSGGDGAAVVLSEPPDASHMTPPTSSTAPAAPPNRSPVLDFLTVKDGSVAKVGRAFEGARGAAGGSVRRVDAGEGDANGGIAPGAAGAAAAAAAAAQGPADVSTGRSTGLGCATGGGGVRPGSRITLLAGSSSMPTGFAGA